MKKFLFLVLCIFYMASDTKIGCYKVNKYKIRLKFSIYYFSLKSKNKK